MADEIKEESDDLAYFKKHAPNYDITERLDDVGIVAMTIRCKICKTPKSVTKNDLVYHGIMICKSDKCKDIHTIHLYEDFIKSLGYSICDTPITPIVGESPMFTKHTVKCSKGHAAFKTNMWFMGFRRNKPGYRRCYRCGDFDISKDKQTETN